MGIFPPCQPTHLLDGLFGSVCGKTREVPKNVPTREIKATLVLTKKSVADVTDVGASFLDRFHELFGRGVTLQLISSTETGEDKLGKEAHIEDWISKFTSLNADDDATFDVTFHWDESFGFPGAFVIRNHHHSQFYLKTVTLEHVPGYGPVNFVCFSWVYPKHRYQHDRVFFANKAYLPDETPESLQFYREQELSVLQGKDAQPGPFKEWDRVYDYATYNDLCDPGKKDQKRTILGGTSQYPYPRRGKTGRKPNSKDLRYESRLFLLSLNIYVPRDEQFNQVKFSDFIAYALKSVGQMLVPEIKAVFDKTFNEFDTFQDVYDLYEGGLKLPHGPAADKLRHCVPWELLRELMRNDGERFLKLPLPDVIQEDKTAWRTDEEFGREMLAGVNPVLIQRLQEFPIRSKLPRRMYGNQDSTITEEHLEKNMNGLTVAQAIEENKLFILDHHDTLMTYLRRINTTTTKTYASRTVLLLQEDETLKPLAIELSLPGELRDDQGATSDVYTPDEHDVEDIVWQLAKAYAAVNDSGVHQLISHWLHTHAVIEPFVIATNRQLSVLHPINKLLKPHFRDTMHINALARQTLINAGGVLERTVFPGQFALEMSTAVYKSWNFTEQALPEDLIKRGMAIPDEFEPHGIRLVIKDYPYAVDGLEIWGAIKSWVTEYCNFYYTSDDKIQGDTELQSWWKEVRLTGHGDLKEKPWWPAMQTRQDLIQSVTIIIWIASALHAAVNFGQYPYAGFLPNRPTVSRRFMPKPGTPEYRELKDNPEGAFLKTITAQFQTILGVSLIEILSRHTSDEIYLGQREDKEWADEAFVKEGFDRFGKTLVGIEKKITERNRDGNLKNRNGPVKVPYELLFPNTSDWSREGGLVVKGVPNSISI